jgi:hypothetical protein
MKFKNRVVYSKNLNRDLKVLNIIKPSDTIKSRTEKFPKIALSVPRNVCGKGAI